MKLCYGPDSLEARAAAAAYQASNPPASGLTRRKPRSINIRATRAALASFGQLQ